MNPASWPKIACKHGWLMDFGVSTGPGGKAFVTRCRHCGKEAWLYKDDATADDRLEHDAFVFGEEALALNWQRIVPPAPRPLDILSIFPKGTSKGLPWYRRGWLAIRSTW
jgi:hypothetical protein